VDVISLIWQWWETKGYFLIWRVVLPYLDAIGEREHSMHGLMSCRSVLFLDCLSEYVLIRFGRFDFDIGVCMYRHFVCIAC